MDAKRDYVTIEDLVDNEWNFQFLYNPLSQQKPYFTTNLELVLPSMGRMQFVLHQGGQLIQVESYPALVVSRTENWGFTLKNNYVKFETIEKKNPRVKTKEEQEKEEKERQRTYTHILISYLLNLYDDGDDAEDNTQTDYDGEEDLQNDQQEQIDSDEDYENGDDEDQYESYEQLQ